jgi:hypothetical protein
MIRPLFAQLLTALGFLTRLPVQRREGGAAGGDASLALVLAAGLIGAAASVAAWLLYWLAGPIAGALLGGMLVPPFLWWLTRGRGLRALLAVAQSQEAAISRADDYFLRMAAFQAILVVKLLATGLLIHAGATPWLFIVWLLVGSVFAEEMGAALGTRDGQATAPSWHWGAAAVGSILAGGILGQFMGALFLVVLVWLARPVARRWLAAHVDLRGIAFSWLLVETTETALLLLATLVTFAR